ncbi:MAG: hypothetical protein IPK64_00195 [bacterium]|nr:hypothetical protein [bacterium]
MAIVLILSFVMADPGSAQQNTVDNPDLVQCYYWTNGCTPTASAMVFSYWDHYASGVGKFIHWGKLIDWYHSHDGTNNIPNLLDDLTAELGTGADGGTPMPNIRSGLLSTIESVNAYEGSVGQFHGFDDCWDALVSEIDASRPCVYSLFPETSSIGHSTAAWGYRRTMFAKFVVLYDTWDWNPVLPYPANYREDWSLRLYYGGTEPVPAREPWLHTVQLARTDTQDDDILLDQPYGGEVIPAGRPYTIQWYQWGDRIDNVTILMSRNNGLTWTQVASNVESIGAGWHSYDWDVPCVDDADVRIRVQAFDRFFVNIYVAGDGSFDECRIRRVDPVTPSGTHVDRTTVAPGGSCTLSWGASSNALSYELSENGTWRNVGTVREVTKSFASEGRYAYRVRAVGACANSAANTEVTVTVQIPLTEPTGFQASNLHPQCGEPVTLSWQPVHGAVKYELATNGEWRDIGTANNIVLRHDSDGDYAYRVRAIGRYATGPATAPIAVAVRTFCDVWPGDLDNDGAVATSDILSLATFWGRTGGSRSQGGMEWRACRTAAWVPIPATYADADGSGRVDIGDFLAVCVHWNRTHDASGGGDKATESDADPEVLAALYAQVGDAVAGPRYEIRRFLEKQLDIAPPARYALHANRPNPFNPSTCIEYDVPVQTQVRVRIFDVTGRLVREIAGRDHAPGTYKIVWNGDDEQGRSVPAGVYFCRVDAADFSGTRKMTLVK